ncbi:MAG: GC-type dockerin domain-anchored protein [Phycisphaerales bacterium JB060]
MKLTWLIACVGAVWFAGVAFAKQAQPQWAEGVFSLRGTDTPVWDAVVWDDGHGEALYVGGFFTIAGDTAARAVARFDGQAWSALGDGIDGFRPSVRALEVFDDGSGRALYIAGTFDGAAGLPALNIARWDGDAWSTLGDGVLGGSGSIINALAVFDDGRGPALYAGGLIGAVTVEGRPVAVNGVARWDGTSWSPLVGPDGTPGVQGGRVESLAVHDDGSGPALYVGGNFDTAGGEPVNNIARWDGTAWSRVYLGTNGPISRLASYDGQLYAGGSFAVASGVLASNLVRWDGSRWHPVAGPLGEGVSGWDDPVHMLDVVDAGDGPVLLVGGQFNEAGGVPAHGIAQWDGVRWSALGDGLGGTSTTRSARTAVVFNSGGGDEVVAGGYFGTAGGEPANNLARWNGSAWSPLGVRGGQGLPREASAVATFDEGDGPALFVAGDFEYINGVEMNGIARWDGAGWSPLAGGIGDTSRLSHYVSAMAPFDDGSGPALFVGGGMTVDRGAPADYIARWNGTEWSAVGPGLDGGVAALLAIDAPGLEPGLYVGGGFTASDGVGLNGVARWDGERFRPLGSGIHDGVAALALHDDGTGPALYAAASTGSGSAGVHHVFKWDGNTWQTTDAGFEDRVLALASFDDGSGPALYAGGSFRHTGSAPAERIARWDGSSWSPFGLGLSSGFPRVSTLLVADAGEGPMLYAGGQFELAGGEPARSIARWDGVSWRSLGDGAGGVTAVVRGEVWDLAAHDDGSGPAVFAVGDFTGVDGVASSGIARWGVQQTCRADFNGDGALTIFDFLAFQNAFDAGDLAADFDGDGSLTIFDFLTFQNEFDAGCA